MSAVNSLKSSIYRKEPEDFICSKVSLRLINPLYQIAPICRAKAALLSVSLLFRKDFTISSYLATIAKYDEIVKSFLKSSDTLNRAAFARQMGAIWYRGFINRNETFEQMKSSGSLRYIDDFKLLTALMRYVRATNFAQYRTENFELKYYTELFVPTMYKNYDLPCKFFLDSAYTNHPALINPIINNHVDILKGKDAETFRQEVGGALM